jgi:hypothetical protein
MRRTNSEFRPLSSKLGELGPHRIPRLRREESVKQTLTLINHIIDGTLESSSQATENLRHAVQYTEP